MSKTARRLSSGEALVPVLVVLLLFLVGFFMRDLRLSNTTLPSSVLSDSGSSNDDSDSSGSNSGSSDNSGSGSDSSGSGSGGDDDKDEAEVRVETSVGEVIRVKTRTEDGRERIDIYQGGTKLRIETRDGETRVKLENDEDEVENEFEIDENDEVEIDEIATEGAVRVRTRRNQFVVTRNSVGALTDFPVSVDLETNELIITTPAGVKKVTVLPDTAVANMLASKAVSRIVVGADNGESSVQVKTRPDGTLVYEIRGVVDERFLGLFDVLVEKTGVVDANSGEILAVQQNFLSRLIDIFSI